MSKMELLDALEAKKLMKQKWKQYCWTPCIITAIPRQDNGFHEEELGVSVPGNDIDTITSVSNQFLY